MLRRIAVVLLILGASGCSQEYIADEFFIRGHFSIPTSVQMTYFESSPEESSKLFGRENLLVKARFKFRDRQEFDNYMARAQIAKTWNVLPIYNKCYMSMSQLDRFQRANLKQFDSMKEGYWALETSSGTGFLSSRPALRRCPPSDLDQDFLIAVLDKTAMELFVVMKQDY